MDKMRTAEMPASVFDAQSRAPIAQDTAGLFEIQGCLHERGPHQRRTKHKAPRTEPMCLSTVAFFVD